MLEANRTILRRRFPEVYRRIEDVSSPSSFESIDRDRERRLASRWLGTRRWEDGTMLAVPGWGAGEHLRALLEGLPRDARVFCAEHDAGKLRASLAGEDFSSVLSDERLLLGVGEPDDALFAPLGGEAVLLIHDVEALVFAPSYNHAPEYYARFFTEFARQVEFRRKLFGTAVVDAELWQRNTFENLPQLISAPDVAALRGAFAGRAMVIVSAGPSLDESIEFVRSVRANALIVAVNSSYRALRHAGIVPHLVFAADPREFTARGFEGVPVDETWLVTTPIVEPSVPRMFGSRCLTWSGSNLLFSEVRRRCGLAPGTQLIEQGTVSACAVDLAVVVGCEKVCFVGQDLAVRSDGRSHVSDSFYADIQSNQVDVTQCRMLPGNVLPEVPVEEKLYVYLKTFEQLIAARPGLQFLNTSRLGARLVGAPYADFEDAREWIGEEPMSDAFSAIRSRFERARERQIGAAPLGTALESTRTFARNVLGVALRAAYRVETLPDQLAAEPSHNDPLVEEAEAAIEALRRLLESEPREREILEDGRTRLELFRYEEDVRKLRASPPHWHRLQKGREYAWAVAEGAWFLVSMTERATAPDSV